jgi:hypothetical protein
MALKFDIREDDRWFQNTDYTVKVRVKDAAGVPINVAGHSMSFFVKVRASDPDLAAKITKTTPTITVTGTYNADPAISTQEVVIPIVDDDTISAAGVVIVKHGVYVIELKRTDPGLETVYVSGMAVLRASAHRS